MLDYPWQLPRDRGGRKEQLGLTLGGTMFLPEGSILSLTECLWGRWDVAHYRGGNDCYRPQGKLGSVVFQQEIIAITSLEDREKQTQRQLRRWERKTAWRWSPRHLLGGLWCFFFSPIAKKRERLQLWVCWKYNVELPVNEIMNTFVCTSCRHYV